MLFALPRFAMATPPTLDSRDSVPVVQLSPVVVKSLIEARKEDGLTFAVGTPVMADASAGTWDEPAPGRARWRLRIGSDGAHSLSFELRQLTLPPNAQLWVYDRDGHDMQGPIVAASTGSTWLPLVRSNEALIEANMPTEEREDFAIVIERAFHGFADVSGRSWPLDPSSGTGNGASGACNVDVACSAGDAWHPQSRATVMLTIAGTTLCSGTLVNNAQQDDRPLVLTANHCGINDLNVTSTIVYFNVQRGACAGGTWGAMLQNLRGKTLLTNSRLGSNSDFALIELASKPPSSFNAYYSGFDISGAVPTSGVGIHHPSGDDKKLSRFTSPASAASGVCIGSHCGELLSDGFKINAWATNWSKGTTESGSSGSALWNQDGYLVGTLSGGRSECTSTTSNNGGTDYYARLDTAWTQPGANLLSPLSLKSVLDPQNTGCSRVGGKNPGVAAAAACSSSTPPTTIPSPPDASGSNASGGGSSGGGGSAGLLMSPLLLAVLIRRRPNTQPVTQPTC
ncbi:hypothetical protein B1810_13465 [Panacagrimonas perspica]|uniref:trypsin-like serine peptidase n=1 Tax=Panacagrimonas perspica TaxID=381431 RepID=UPI00113A8A34|nr:trypsin-like serine protease [Panacagrimonas perspica]THD02560.1 hypothetical protein B1810_13465 [Panacagrimonas perspica]